MGTEDNVKQGLRSTNKFRCDICGRKFSTETALASHQATVHSNAISRKRNLKATFKAKIVKKVKPKLFLKSKEIATPVESLPTNAIVKINEEAIKISKESVIDDTVFIEDKNASKKGKILATGEKPTKFKCPHCEKSFNMLFPLKMHIARDHRKNNGTPDKIVQAKPSTMSKKVAVSVKEDDIEYMCVGCKANFLNLGQFYSHMENVHSEGKETLYFPTISEFETWREDMQRKLRLKYTTEHKLDDTNSMHTCPRKVLIHTQCIGENVTVLCPSMILVQKSSEGCTVCFFKQHFGHDSRKYVLADKFKKYSVITPVEIADDNKQETENSSPAQRIEETEVDKLLYDKFKSIMDGIVKDAEKLDESGLKTFIDRALQMSSALTSYASNVCKVVGHLTDVTMTPVKVVKSFDDDLNEPKSKDENIEIKTEPSENKTVETIDSSIDDSVKITLEKKVSEVPKISVKSNSELLSEEIKNVVESQKVMTQTVSSNEVTKVVSPIFDAPSSKTNIIKMQTSNKETSSNNELTSPKNSPVIITGSPVSDKKTNKVAPMTIASPIKVAKDEQVILKKRKIVMKTKMGQFIPNSPKRIKSSTETNSRVAKEITDKRNNLNSIKYKVIEQENDCNILVLKSNIF